MSKFASIFGASSTDLLEEVYARAGIRFERIVDALEMAREQS